MELEPEHNPLCPMKELPAEGCPFCGLLNMAFEIGKKVGRDDASELIGLAAATGKNTLTLDNKQYIEVEYAMDIAKEGYIYDNG